MPRPFNRGFRRRDPSRWAGASKPAHRWQEHVPTSEIGRLRRAVHDAFDPLWKAGDRRRFNTRVAAYVWLASALGLSDAECHVRLFDEETCRRALEAVRSIA